MLGSDWVKGCPSCSYVGDHFSSAVVHLAARDVSLVMVSRAPLAEIEEAVQAAHGLDVPVGVVVRQRLRQFPRVVRRRRKVAGKPDYNYTVDRIPQQEVPGLSAFIRDRTRQVSIVFVLHAGSTCWSARTPFSTWLRRAATRTTCPGQWPDHRHDEYGGKPKSGSCCASLARRNRLLAAVVVKAALRLRPGQAGLDVYRQATGTADI